MLLRSADPGRVVEADRARKWRATCFRRPVVGIAALQPALPTAAYVLIRRSDSGRVGNAGRHARMGQKTLRTRDRARAARRGAARGSSSLGEVIGVYSRPDRGSALSCRHGDRGRDGRAAVTHPPDNPLEILEVRAFAEAELPSALSHGMSEMLQERPGRASDSGSEREQGSLLCSDLACL